MLPLSTGGVCLVDGRTRTVPRSGPAEKSLLPRVAQFHALRRADVVILQRKLLPLWQLALLRSTAKRLIYDVDDALFQRDSYHAKGPESWLRRRRFAATVRMADLVIAGNDYLRRRSSTTSNPSGCGSFRLASSPAGTLPPHMFAPGGRPLGLDRPTQHARLAAMRAASSGRRRRAPAGTAIAGDFRLDAGPFRRPRGAATLVVSRPRPPNSPGATSASIGCRTTPGAAASAACACCNTWPPACRWSPIRWA